MSCHVQKNEREIVRERGGALIGIWGEGERCIYHDDELQRGASLFRVVLTNDGLLDGLFHRRTGSGFVCVSCSVRIAMLACI